MKKDFFSNISGSLNNLLYNSREVVSVSLKSIAYISSFTALILIIYAYGFEPGPYKVEKAFLGLDIIFGIFVANFLVRFLYSFQRKRFIKENLFETILIGFIILNGISNYLFGTLLLENLFRALNIQSYGELYKISVTLFIFVLLGLEITKASAQISKLKMKPSTIFILSFLLLIAIGTGLLMLPAMTHHEGNMPFLEALFTSVSASCVTGLIVVDTATYFTFKGQIIIMLLIQVGGLGIISFATFFASFFGQGVGIKHQLMIQDFLITDSLRSAKGLLKQIIIITILIELITFILIFFTWGDDFQFKSLKDQIFFSLFHAISAFCNAGFSLFTNGLYEPFLRFSYILHIVIIISVILGGIGFPTIQDLFSPTALRERLRNPWKDWHTSTKIAVFMSFILLSIGTILFYLLEKDNVLKNLNLMEALITSFFQSGTARTAGFNTVDMSKLQTPTLFVITILMFIGASSGSVGGGIKTSTIYVIIALVIATIKGKLKIEIGRRYIPNNLVFRALSIFMFAVSFNLICIFFLTITESDFSILQLTFEQVSAFGTVGLSTGITAELSSMGKIIIIITMFLGRVGTLTVALALSSRAKTTSYRYPKAHVMVG